MWQAATKYPGNALPHRPTLLQYVVSSKVCSIDCCLFVVVCDRIGVCYRISCLFHVLICFHATFLYLVVDFPVKN